MHSIPMFAKGVAIHYKKKNGVLIADLHLAGKRGECTKARQVLSQNWVIQPLWDWPFSLPFSLVMLTPVVHMSPLCRLHVVG